MGSNNFSLLRKQAKQLKQLRNGLMLQLYPTKGAPTIGMNGTEAVLTNLLGSFQRFVGNQQTAYDDGAVRSSPMSSSASSLERQVDSAIAQALKKTPGRGATNFVKALDAAYPWSTNGAMAGISSRSQAVLFNAHSDVASSGLGELSTRQMALHRQTSIIAADALKILEELHSFVPDADNDRVEALRSLIQHQITLLIEEFGRADEPRAARVESALKSLREYVSEFGRQAQLNDPMLVAILDDENQTTKFELLSAYTKSMSQAWVNYSRAERSGKSYSLSEKVDRARVILPIVSQAAIDFSDALESVGLSESERRSRASLFSTLNVVSIQQSEQDDISGVSQSREPRFVTVKNQIGQQLPNITVSDLIDWLDRFSNIEAPSALESTYGIDFVTDQADRLFWTIAAVVAHLKTTTSFSQNSKSMLEQILSNERVSWSLDNLLSQLKALADLAA
ncbi:hypothetical protein [Leptolyngbya sp. FACHB-16]|uniref:hypothetical protein n=1 Tax=unclassified Leptolyngbya TaxID=2650499 RepID=UPI00168344A3|nr:hypothetical protein [Leptolyngbya sp. FACHB-16]MBD2157864.1 hypothetical protein [Leptolyngbya sp. FACHB-16]